MNEMPKFTKYGYKKMKMPEELHSLILQVRNSSRPISETCHIPNCELNCYKWENVIAPPFKHRKRRIASKILTLFLGQARLDTNYHIEVKQLIVWLSSLVEEC